MALLSTTITADLDYFPVTRPPENQVISTAVPRGLYHMRGQGDFVATTAFSDTQLIRIFTPDLLPRSYTYELCNTYVSIARDLSATDQFVLDDINAGYELLNQKNMDGGEGLIRPLVGVECCGADSTNKQRQTIAFNDPGRPSGILVDNGTGMSCRISIFLDPDVNFPAGTCYFWFTFLVFDVDQQHHWALNAPQRVIGA